MEQLSPFFDPIWVENLQVRAEHWLLTEVLTWTSLLQLAVLAVAALVSWPVGRAIASGLNRFEAKSQLGSGRLRGVVPTLRSLAFPVAYLLLLSISLGGLESAGLPFHIVTIAISILTAWLVIRLATSVIANREVARVVSLLAWAVATLNILGLLGPLQRLLSDIAVPLGENRITLLSILQAIVLFAVLLWASGAAGRVATAYLNRSQTLTPSIKVLAEKALRIALFTAIILLTLEYIGVDLTAFAVFTGAVGVGVGFGLQKVISNLISGFILLLDRSIKPGDVIEIGDTFGWVTSLSARYVALTTRDGRELLIPNEDLITQQVINWSYTSKLLRVSLKFGISYDSDVRKAMELALDAAASVERVHTDPAPVCRLTGFGDSSVDFELRIWIHDPEAGVVNVKSDVYLALWDRFHEHGIVIPFPQRDVTIKNSEIQVVRADRGEPAD